MKIQVLHVSDSIWLETLQKFRHDIYQLPDYFALEAARNMSKAEAILLKDEDKIMFVPYLLRSCEDIGIDHSISTDFLDVVSPYGYPGILLNEAATNTPDFLDIAISQLREVLQKKGVCSAFFRLHPIINDNFGHKFQQQNILTLNGKTVSINLQLSDEDIWKQTKRDRRKKINHCQQVGLTATMVPLEEYMDEFVAIYVETMERVKADKLYYSFHYKYFLEMQNILKHHLNLCIVEINNQLASAGLYTECCGIVQAIFRGTRTKFIELSPSSLEIDYVRFWAKKRGNQIFHLGGGLGGSQNSLYNFKASFSKQRHNFMTMRLIIDEEKYLYLVKMRAKELKLELRKIQNSQFFPAYRYA
ncbi:MAG: peptidoglycan bridge formation glycyltransferase FemA/FemB family protein [Calothrix sp. MO_192.B10]|nr:peptidoglycan bridge formation glycyltransferase FemA/FemB family protein [Calothrix sp. MO_192.B10]